MGKTLLLGVLAGALAVGVVLLFSVLGLPGLNSVVAVAAGILLGLIRDKTPIARYGAFLVGLVLGLVAIVAAAGGWIGFLIAIVVFTIISALTGGRLPLWAMILGGSTFAAMYFPLLEESGWYILTQYPTTFFLALAASSGAFIVAVFAELILGQELAEHGRLESDADISQTEKAV